MLCKVTHCAGRISANTRPHQLRWGDWEMGLLCHAQNAVRWLALFMWLVEVLRRHRLFVQLYFMQLPFIRNRNCHMLLMHVQT